MPSINDFALFQDGRAASEEIVLSRERRRLRRRRRREESPRKQHRGRRSVGLQQSEDALEAESAFAFDDATAPPAAATEQRGIVLLVEASSESAAAKAFVPSGKRESVTQLTGVGQLNLTRQ